MVDNWVKCLVMELQRDGFIQGIVASVATTESGLNLWGYDMIVISLEAMDEASVGLQAHLAQLAFHRAVIVYSLQDLCYQCFTGVQLHGVQNGVLAEKPLKTSAYDALLPTVTISSSTEHIPDGIKILVGLLSRENGEASIASGASKDLLSSASSQYTSVQMRRAKALRSIMCKAHEFNIKKIDCINLSAFVHESAEVGSLIMQNVMMYSVIAEIINYCKGEGALSKEIVSFSLQKQET